DLSPSFAVCTFSVKHSATTEIYTLSLHDALPISNFDVEDVARWLEEFHPHSLVELDYGGLVHLMDDEALQADQSVAELSAALTGLDTGQEELAYAMYQRVILRWKSMQLLESSN